MQVRLSGLLQPEVGMKAFFASGIDAFIIASGVSLASAS
jgi:hypothetical protein